MTLSLGTSTAVSATLTVPSSAPTLPASAPPEGAPVPAPAAAVSPSTSSTGVTSSLRLLRIGSSGATVTDLQRELRRRGYRVAVDGRFGPSTYDAVRRLQRRLRLRVTGSADAVLLRRVGVQVRSIASGTTAAPGATTVSPSGSAAPVASGTRQGRYLKTFPVNGPNTYIDDWGAPRGQGPHQGNDIMASRGTPVVAVADGVIQRLTRVETGLGGIWIWLRDTAGNEYYYAHLDTIVATLREGSRVSVGQLIATVGNTGDARYAAPHLHFEIHPGGGGAVDPRSELLAVDPDPPTRSG